MSLQIANPKVVGMVERLAAQTGLSKTAAVEQAVDMSLRALEGTSAPRARLVALLAQIDRIPDRSDATDPMEWDAHGLPR